MYSASTSAGLVCLYERGMGAILMFDECVHAYNSGPVNHSHFLNTARSYVHALLDVDDRDGK